MLSDSGWLVESPCNAFGDAGSHEIKYSWAIAPCGFGWRGLCGVFHCNQSSQRDKMRYVCGHLIYGDAK